MGEIAPWGNETQQKGHDIAGGLLSMCVCARVCIPRNSICNWNSFHVSILLVTVVPAQGKAEVSLKGIGMNWLQGNRHV